MIPSVPFKGMWSFEFENNLMKRDHENFPLGHCLNACFALQKQIKCGWNKKITNERDLLNDPSGKFIIRKPQNQNFYQYGVPIKESLLCLVRVFLAETPKSASFTSPSIVRSTLPAFRSRCMTLLK